MMNDYPIAAIASSLIFLVGYLLIIFEHPVKINKSATALLTGVLGLIAYLILGEGAFDTRLHHLHNDFAKIAEIVFFLIGAMVIVEIIDAHQGFHVLGQLFRLKSPHLMMWALLIVGFILSGILDNLTTIIVMISLLRKLISSHKERILIASALVIAVNIGGAWTPIGDVTTTMLWIEGNITTLGIMKALFLPCVISLIVLGLSLRFLVPDLTFEALQNHAPLSNKHGMKRVLITGILCLLMVPTLKVIFDIPPFMGMLLAVGVMWVLTDLTHKKQEGNNHLKVQELLQKIDVASSLFFLGILMAVNALELTGVLGFLSNKISAITTSPVVIASTVGIVSAIVDNIPLVAACIRMYSLETYPPDHTFWALIALTAGTGGSLLIIGSAPGVALMALEKVGFFWYLKRISWIALLSYIAGIASYMALERL